MISALHFIQGTGSSSESTAGRPARPRRARGGIRNGLESRYSACGFTKIAAASLPMMRRATQTSLATTASPSPATRLSVSPSSHHQTCKRAFSAVSSKTPTEPPPKTTQIAAGGVTRTSGLPDFVEKWGRKPFQASAATLMTTSVGAFTYYPGFATGTLVALSSAFTALGVRDMTQSQHTVLRNFPVLGHVRYAFEAVRPEIRQYFIESDQEANPFTREQRTLVYARAKSQTDVTPFGTKRDVYSPGYEFIGHSMYPARLMTPEDSRVIFGASRSKPYSASIFNVSAMSFGAISDAAVLALNTAAKRGDFYHNTGEGGVSQFHLAPGGSIVWNIGTGYFGARDSKGNFDPAKFKETSSREAIKMIEIKLSQGAKPGHGGILPGKKVTPEIAFARGVNIGEDCVSPPAHKAFSDARGLLRFAEQLRELSGGKPVGAKLCVGHPHEVGALVAAMVETGITLDFITVDGKEGGTGASPLEYTNHVGMPLTEGLHLVSQLLRGAGIKDQVRIIAAGRVTSGFSLLRTLAMGADVANSARGMMFALGCIQSLKCHTNKCPTGVATQDKELTKGLVVPDKADRVYHFHRKTVEACLDLVASAGCESIRDINESHLMIRTSGHSVQQMSRILKPVPVGALRLNEESVNVENDFVLRTWQNGLATLRASK